MNDQFHAVGVLEDVSVKFTASGAVPDVALTVNEATGAAVTPDANISCLSGAVVCRGIVYLQCY